MPKRKGVERRGGTPDGLNTEADVPFIRNCYSCHRGEVREVKRKGYPVWDDKMWCSHYKEFIDKPQERKEGCPYSYKHKDVGGVKKFVRPTGAGRGRVEQGSGSRRGKRNTPKEEG